LFATTLIPLRLITENDVILWNNRISQSGKFCRLIKFHFIQESKKVILTQKYNIEQQIKQLDIFEYKIENYSITINFSFHMTLIDGKVLNIITNINSMQSCSICYTTKTI